mmetsp:Transcript_41903/g.99782  ORF Transcript_41903/g.99782 Transcript_41903/m.99782 type:complete len:217 (-) Transcript_41903:442-1092(-)
MRGFTSMKTKRAEGSSKPPATMNSTVPTPRYWQLSSSRTAHSVIRSRSPGWMRAGATSTTFWFLSCTLQSRSYKCAHPPWPSANTWTSMCRASSRNSSRKTEPLPKAVLASLVQRSKASFSSSSCRTRRMPRPPPPNAALKMIGSGKDSRRRKSRASCQDPRKGEPFSTGTSLSTASSRARTLSPSSAMVSARGPMKVMPLASQAAANSALSDRKP